MRSLLPAMLLLGASACKPATWLVLDGDLLAQEPFFQSAFWVRDPSGEPDRIIIQLDSFPDACQTWTSLAAAGHAYQSSYVNPSASSTAWVQQLPDFFWQSRIELVSPYEDYPDNSGFELDTDLTLAADRARARIFGWIGLPTDAYFANPSKPYVDRVDWVGQPGGELFVLRPTNEDQGDLGGRVAARFATEGDGSRAVESQMAIAFNAEHCTSLEALSVDDI